MFAATIKNLAAHKLRLLTTSIAVMLGVAFMAGTLVLTDTIGKTFDGLFADVNAGTSAYLRSASKLSTSSMEEEQRARLDTSLLDTVRRVEGVEVAEGSITAYARLIDKDGDPIGNPNLGAPTYGANWLVEDRLNPFDLAAGRAPQGDREVVVDKASADQAAFTVGDPAKVVTQTGTQDVTVVGIARFGDADSPAGASFALFTPDAAERYLTAPGKVDAIKVVAAEGISDGDLVGRIAAAVPEGVEVLTGAEITAEDRSDAKEGLSFFNTFLLAFAVVALFVGSFIIYNSFSILVAQRSREMALLRAIGASRRQVLGSVLFEALIVGVVASTLGLVAGVGVASLLQALLSAVGLDIPAGGVVITAKTVIVAVVSGLVVSVVAAVFPARKAAKVAPVAAMRAVAVDSSARSGRRFVAGVVVTGLGVALMAGGLFADSGIAAVGLGAVVVFLGVAVLGPVLARPASRLLGAPLPRLRGVAGRLARENAMRNPKRTSATAAALMIGVGLVGFITILASSTKATIADVVDTSIHSDFIVDSGAFGDGGFNEALTQRLASLPEVDLVSPIGEIPAEINGTGEAVVTVDPATFGPVFDAEVTAGDLTALDDHGLAVLAATAERNGWHVGDVVPVRFAETGQQSFTVRAIFAPFGGSGGAGNGGVPFATQSEGDYVVSRSAAAMNKPGLTDSKLFVTVNDGVSTAQGQAALEQATSDYPTADVQDRDQFKDAQGKQIDQVLNLMYALLALAVFIALLGIANTLALSILERTRELGLLRAVGMTRSQIRSTVRWESVIIALFGTGLGLLIGIGFGWAIVKALAEEGLNVFNVPVGQLVVVAVIAAIAGVAAAILPARRAARLNVLDAITAE